jgi:hypothetical protein
MQFRKTVAFLSPRVYRLHLKCCRSNGIRSMNLYERVIQVFDVSAQIIRDMTNSHYVTTGRLRFRFVQILLNAVVLLAIAGGLAVYFKSEFVYLSSCQNHSPPPPPPPSHPLATPRGASLSFKRNRNAPIAAWNNNVEYR